MEKEKTMKNSQKYTTEEISSLYNREQLARAVSYTTCYEWNVNDILNGIDRENGKPEKSPINKKDNMIEWLFNWFDDDCLVDQPDMIEFIDEFKD